MSATKEKCVRVRDYSLALDADTDDGEALFRCCEEAKTFHTQENWVFAKANIHAQVQFDGNVNLHALRIQCIGKYPTTYINALHTRAREQGSEPRTPMVVYCEFQGWSVKGAGEGIALEGGHPYGNVRHRVCTSGLSVCVHYMCGNIIWTDVTLIDTSLPHANTTTIARFVHWSHTEPHGFLDEMPTNGTHAQHNRHFRMLPIHGRPSIYVKHERSSSIFYAIPMLI